MKNFNPELVIAVADAEQDGESATSSQADSFYNFEEDINIKIGYAD